MLSLKQLSPTRLLKNEFYRRVLQLEQRGAEAEALQQLLGRGRAKKGIFEGDLEEGELEIGQVVSQVKKIDTVAQIFARLQAEYHTVASEVSSAPWL